MSTVVTITTYNRPEMLVRLLGQLAGQEVEVVVYDDGSTVEMPELDCEYSTGPHVGRDKFWMLIDCIFGDMRGRKFDHWIHLPDDVEVGPDMVTTAVETWRALRWNDPKAVCLNLLKPERGYKMQWTAFNPVLHRMHGHMAYKTQWNDLCFVTDRSLGEALEWRIDPVAPDIHNMDTSSGVGAQISKRLHNFGYSMYGVYETLVHHDAHESLMNPEERRTNPITT